MQVSSNYLRSGRLLYGRFLMLVLSQMVCSLDTDYQDLDVFSCYRTYLWYSVSVSSREAGKVI